MYYKAFIGYPDPASDDARVAFTQLEYESGRMSLAGQTLIDLEKEFGLQGE